MSLGVKLCGMSREVDIDVVNQLKPEYIGFVFWDKSKRNVSKETAKALKAKLDKDIKAVGVFVSEDVEKVAELLNEGIIDIAQLHGNEDGEYIENLRKLADKPLIQAFKVKSEEDVAAAQASTADMILLDSGKGSGKNFNWQFMKGITREYFLAGGLDENTAGQIEAQLVANGIMLPIALDVSSGIETDGLKDPEKMKKFVEMARSI